MWKKKSQLLELRLPIGSKEYINDTRVAQQSCQNFMIKRVFFIFTGIAISAQRY